MCDLEPHRIRRVVGVVAASLAAALAAAGPAAAATTIGPLPASATLVERLYVPLTISVACDPPAYSWDTRYLGVTIRQAVHREVAYGGATSSALTCDGEPHDVELDVFPSTSGPSPSPPFRKGDAVIGAQIFSYYTSSPAASAGPQTIRLR